MEKKEYTLIVIGAVAVATFLGFVGCGLGYLSLHRQLAEIQSELRPQPRRMGAMPFRVDVATPISPAAADSLEGQLRSQGKRWERTQGQIEEGAYVEDILKNRMNQPQGRGWLGKVVSVSDDAATVDFGRGYVVGILKSELCPVNVTDEDHKL
ncbi:MAG: hypothetical protein ABSF38_11705 [Verrucomicrobiota bacterium]|jgi:hypothetical protein